MKYSMINKKTVMLVLSFFAFLFLWGCAEDFQSQRKDPFFEKWSTMADTAQGHSPYAQPKKIDTAALSSKKTAATPLMGPETRKLPQSPIHLTMRQADLKAVLRAMAKSVNLNLLVKNELKGEISVDFKGVAWDKAFTGLLQTYGLSYVWEGDIIRVMTIEDVEQELKRKVQMRDIQWVDPLLDPVVINIDYADPKKLADTLQDFLTKDKDGKPRGSVKVNEHTNALIISATSEDMKKILPIIEKLDKPTAQILIKANIVETSKGVARDLGIIWGGYNKGKLGGQEDLIVTGTGVSPLGSIDSTARLGMNFPAALDTSTPLGSLGLFFGKISGNMLEVQLQALQKDNKLNILSSPSITTLDNHKASTKNGERVPYVTTDTSGATPTQTTMFEDVVLLLEITPHVIDGKNLKMEILVKKDEVDMTRKSSMGDPYIIKKETKTELIVQDGETIVISGLTKQRKSKGESGVPWLKDVPILGWAFKSDSKGDNMEEVLIFITPHILPVGSS